MANKFQQSVLERLELEQKKGERKPKQEMAAKEKPAETPAAQPDREAPPQKQTGPQGPDLTPSRVEGYLRKTPARQAKNKTFYLDLEVIQGIRQAAQGAGVADSKLVNDILRTVLELED